MSYDLMVFEPGAAPEDRHAFIAWFSQVVRLREGHMASEPTCTTPRLRDWYADMSAAFPHVREMPVRPFTGTRADDFATDYRFHPQAVFARFEWKVSRRAYHIGMRHARWHQLGFFDASGESASVYTVANGRLVLAHRGERLTDGPEATTSR